MSLSCCSQVNGGMNGYDYIGVAGLPLTPTGAGPMLNGLGQLDPATLLAINEAFVHAKDLWQDILNIFGVGAGAREADAITPLQNQIVQTIIAPVSDFLTRVNGGQVTPTCQELQTWKSQVLQAKQKWDDFLHKTVWKDGRAAQQAEATLAPYWTNSLRDLDKYISQYCGIIGGGGIPTPLGNISLPMLALAGGAIYLLTRKR